VQEYALEGIRKK